MAEYNAGDARLRVVPDASNFARELEAKLKTVNNDFLVNIRLNTSQARADMERFRNQEQSKAISQNVNVQLSRAEAEMAKFREEQRAKAVALRVQMDGAAARAAGQSAGAAAKAGVLNEFNDVAKSINKAFSSGLDLAKTIGITGLIANIPAAVTAVVSLTQAIEQLSGAALVIPGAIGGAIASFGTLAFGVSGVSDAVSALIGQQNRSASQMGSITSAHNALRNAVVDEANAQKDVARARRDAKNQLEDLNIELRGSSISEAQALNDIAKAKRDLAKGGFQDSLDYEDAVLRVQEAEQRGIEVHERSIQLTQKVGEENTKGIDGSDQVVAANERLVRSQQSVEAAQQSLLSAGGADKVTQALAQLGPAAAEFANALADLKPQYDSLQKLVSNNLFDGLSSSMTNFVNGILPNLRTGLGSIATTWNTVINSLFTSLGSQNSKGLLDRLLGNTSEAQKRFANAIDPLVRGIGTLVSAGSDSLPRIADAIGNVAERFANFIEAADKDGRLAGWIDKGLTGFADLGNSILNVFQALHNINTALGGNGILGSLKDVTEKFKEWTGSAEGQAQLKKFFDDAKKAIDELKPVIADVVSALPGIWQGAKAAFDVVMPMIKEFSDLIGKHPQLVRDVVAAFAFWKGITGVTSLITDLTKITNLLGGKGKGGKGGGGKGILGKLALLVGGGLALDSIVNSDDSSDPDTQAADKAADHSVPAGDAPVGAPPPLSGVPGAHIPLSAGKSVAEGALSALLLSKGQPAAGLLGAYLGIPADQIPAKAEADFNSIVQAIPLLPDADLKSVADMFKLTPDQLKATSRDVLHQRYLDLVAGKPVEDTSGLTPQQKNILLPSHKDGGPTKAGLAMLHDDEWVLPSHARAAIGDTALEAITAGRRYWGGGLVGPDGNPLAPGGTAPGPAPGAGPAPVAPNPTAATSPLDSFLGGIAGVATSALGVPSSLQGLFQPGNKMQLTDFSKMSPTQIGDRFSGLPGVWGLLAGQMGSDPKAAMGNWMSQTGKWLGNFAGKTALSLGSTLYEKGFLGALGLQNSILSPSNQWTGDLISGAQGLAGTDGANSLLGSVVSGGSSDLSFGSQDIAVGKGESISIPTIKSGSGGSSSSSYSPSGVSAAAGGGANAYRSLVTQIVASRGLSPQWIEPLLRQIQTESGGNARSINDHDSDGRGGTQVVQGLFNFLPSTFYGSGGHDIWDPADQINTAISYVLGKYGQTGGTPNWIGVPGRGFATGGPTPHGMGPLPDGGYPAVVHPGEFMISARGRATVPDAFLHQLNAGQLKGFEVGGNIPPYVQALIAPQPVPPPHPVVQAQMMVPPSQPVTPVPPPVSSVPTSGLGGGAADISGIGSAARSSSSAPSPLAPAPSNDSLNHNLPAVRKGIASTASTLGSIAAMAINAAAAGGTMGASAVGGMGGGGGAGALAQGLFTQGGKIVDDAVNVFSSFLVGNAPGSSPYSGPQGPLHPAQNAPLTAADNRREYTFNGIDGRRIVDDMRLQHAQEQQAELAHMRG